MWVPSWFDCCCSSKDYPKDVRLGQTWVDKQNEVIFLPVFGVPVPFSIATIKSVSLSNEGDSHVLRINFQAPSATGTTFPKDLAPSVRAVMKARPELMYLRTVSVRAKVRMPSMKGNTVVRRPLTPTICAGLYL